MPCILCHLVVLEDEFLNRHRNCKCHLSHFLIGGHGDYTTMRTSSIKCHLQCSCESEPQTASLNIESNLGRFSLTDLMSIRSWGMPLTSLKINCVLREMSEKHLNRGVFNKLNHINLSLNFTLHVHEIRQGFLTPF